MLSNPSDECENVDPKHLCDPQNLAELSSLEWRARILMENMKAGQHRSPNLGSSMDFAQHRAYVPGDDLRHLDWKILARSDKQYVRQYHQETSLDLALWIDASASMNFQGERSPWRKIDMALTLAATVVVLASENGDKAHLVIDRGDNTRSHSQNSSQVWIGKHSKQDLISALQWEKDHRGQTNKLIAAKQNVSSDALASLLPRRHLVLWISDFMDEPKILEKRCQVLRSLGHELILLQTLDPDECELRTQDACHWQDLETGERQWIDPRGMAKTYHEVFEQHQQSCQKIARQSQSEWLSLRTHRSFVADLMRLMHQRERRKM